MSSASTRAAAVPAAARYAIVAEAHARDCEIVSLLAGAYGSIDYVVDQYGFNRKTVERVVSDAETTEMLEFVKDESGHEITVGQLFDVMQWAHERYEAAEERARERMRDGQLTPA